MIKVGDFIVLTLNCKTIRIKDSHSQCQWFGSPLMLDKHLKKEDKDLIVWEIELQDGVITALY